MIPVTRIGLNFMRKRARQTLQWSRIKPGDSLLEIGPGRGVLAREAIDMGIHYTALDRDTSNRERMPWIPEFIIDELPFFGAFTRRYNVIVCESVLEHASGYTEALDTMRIFAEVLFPGGHLVLRVPAIQFATWSFWEYTEDHQYVTSLPRAVTLMEAGGFEIVRAGYGLDHFTGVWVWPIWIAAQASKWPVRLLEWLQGKPGYRMNLSVKLKYKQPHCFVVGRKP